MVDSTRRALQLGAHLVLDGAEILTDHHGAGAVSLQGQEVEQIVVGVSHVGTLGRTGAGRDPVQPEQTHHVIDTQARAAGEGGSQRRDERLVARGPQLPRNERWQTPILAAVVERVGRRPHATPDREFVLIAPRVGATRLEADGEIAHEPDSNAPGREQLALDVPLAPLVEPHPAGVGRRKGSDRRVAGMAQLDRPLGEVATVHVGEHAEQREAMEAPLACLAPCIEGVAAGRFEVGKEHLEGRAFHGEHRVAIEPVRRVQLAADAGQGLERIAEAIGSGDVSDAQEVDVAPHATRREVGARLLGGHRNIGVKGIGEHDAGAESGRPAGQLSQIAEVADSPTGRRTQGVQLRRPAPGAGDRRAPTRGDDDHRRDRFAVRDQLVVADGQVGGQLGDAGELGRVLEP